MLKNVKEFLCSLWFCMGFVVFGILAIPAVFASVAAYIILFFDKNLQSRAISRIIQITMALYVFSALPKMGGYTVKLCGKENLNKADIYVANHTSFIDPFIMLALIGDAGILVKTKYKRNPFILIFFYIFNFVSISKDDILSVQNYYKKCAEVLTDNHRLIIFPEGQRSRNCQLADFKKSAFKLAKELNKTVATCTIRFSDKFMAKGQKSFRPKFMQTLTICIGKPINPKSYRNADAISAKAYNEIYLNLKSIDANLKNTK